MKSKICLIRHGITEGNKNRLYYGHSDIPLASEGVDELVRLAKAGIYPDSASAEFYTTGLTRTEQTLFLIYGDRPHGRIDALREINFGDFEMKTYEELKDTEEYRIWVADEKGELAPPGGESVRAFYERIREGFAELKNRHLLKTLSMRHQAEEALSVVVCHGGSISAVMEALFPGEKENFYQWIPDPGHGYLLTLENGEVTDTEKF